MFGHRPPLWKPGAFRRRLKALSSIRGSPTKLAFPIGVHHVQGMLRLIGLSPVQRRNVVLVACGTVMCARPCEVPSVQACDVHWGVDAAFHSRYEDGVGIKVKKRKNDTARRGLMTRVPGSHLQRMMMAYSQMQRSDISPRCTMPVLSAVLSEGRATAGSGAAATRQRGRCAGGDDTSERDGRYQVGDGDALRGFTAVQRQVHATRRPHQQQLSNPRLRYAARPAAAWAGSAPRSTTILYATPPAHGAGGGRRPSPFGRAPRRCRSFSHL